MNRTELKQWLESNIYTKNGKINPNSSKKMWWDNSGNIECYDCLLNETSFLPEERNIKERIYCVMNDITVAPRCNCGNVVNFEKKKYNKHCSTKCSSLDKNVKQKMIETNLDRYGVPHANLKKPNSDLNSTLYNKEWLHEQHVIKKRSLVDISTQIGVNRSLVRDSCIRFSIPITRYNKTTLNDEAYKLLNDKEWFRKQYVDNNKTFQEIGDILSISDRTACEYAKKHNIPTNISNVSSAPEREIVKYIESIYSGKILTTDRNTISPKELDIVIPEKRLAIEYCGLYWHSSEMGKHKNYHKEKYDECESIGYQLLTIFEDEWMLKKDIVKSMIKHKLGLNSDRIYARNTEVKEVLKEHALPFLEKYHIQGYVNSSIKLGLFCNNELVSVLLGKYMSGTIEITRFATSKHVVGGFSKLLSHLRNNFEYNNIITFADLRYSNGNLYNSLGFKPVKHLSPDYYYFKKMDRKHKFNFRKASIKKKLEVYDDKYSEKELMGMNGYMRIYDCGKIKYEIT